MSGKSASRRKKRKARTAGRPEMAPVAPSQVLAGGGGGKSSWRLPVLLFAVCFGAYAMNGDVLMGADQETNMRFGVNVLKHRSLSLAPPHAPDAFTWTLQRSPEDTGPVELTRWNSKWDALYRKGELRAAYPYSMVPTVHPGQYANTFGFGAMLTLLPVYAALNLFTDLAADRSAWWHGAKVTASLLTAGAVVCIFLAMRRFLPPLPAALGALAFGLGTCAWSLSSQGLWQQTPFLFFLSLGAWCLFAAGQETTRRPAWALYCGAALGMATLCRPTGAIAVVCVGLYLLWLAPPRLLPRLLHSPGAAGAAPGEERPGGLRRFPALPPVFAYVLGGLPFAALLGAYNAYYFGNPFVFGQGLAAEWLVRERGVAGVWQTPLAEGLAGLLCSPSRGLLVYSPIMALGLAGAVMMWKSPRTFAPLIPLQAAVLLQVAVAAKWYDWWGGWTYGPRPIVDAGVFLSLLTIPVIARVVQAPRMRGVFAALFLYSVAVQAVGAWAYNIVGWNDKDGMNIDQPEHRSRLWSLSDSQLAYYATHFRLARAQKQHDINYYLYEDTTPIIVGPRKGASFQ